MFNNLFLFTKTTPFVR